jgi:uncharacterized protein YjbI with pentapeptide repeats
MARLDPGELEERLRRHAVWVSSLGADGEQLWLPDADLSGVDWSDRELADAHLPGVRLDNANLSGAFAGGSFLFGATLCGADLSRIVLGKSNLDQVRANGAIFRESNLIKCTFFDADLRGAVFDQAQVFRTSFYRSDLRGATMRHAELDRTLFESSLLGAMDCTGARGSIMRNSVTLDENGERRPLDPESLREWLLACGATDVTFFAP